MHQQILVQDAEGWMEMKTVPSNSLSVVMVEDNTSVDATVTMIASKSSSKSLKFDFWLRAPLLPQDHHSQTLAKRPRSVSPWLNQGFQLVGLYK